MFISVLLLPGCDKWQDQINELYAEVDSLRVSDRTMRAQLDQMNSSLSALGTIVSALQTGLYVKSVVPVTGDDFQTGYLITLSNGDSFTVWNGRNGQNGHSPVFGIRQGEDGAYYWTLDGELLLDSQGRPVRADGVTPLFDIRDGHWFLSVDGGATWRDMGIATGSDGQPGQPGDQIFSNVDYTPGENVVTFVLADGTSITLPCYQPISISFTVPDNQTSIASGETVKVDYTLSHGDDNTVVTASTDGNFIVAVQKKDNVSGSILITCPGLYLDGHVNVMAFDGVGYAAVSVITFYEKVMSFHNGLSYSAGVNGGTISIPLSFNFDYSLVVAPESESWITVVQTRADVRDGTIILNVAKNEGDGREGRVFLYADNAVGSPYATINVVQDGTYFRIGNSSFVFGSDGGDGEVSIRTSKTISVKVPSEAGSWASASLNHRSGDSYYVSVSVSPNASGLKRSVSIPVTNTMDGAVLGTVEILQLAGNDGSEMDLVFEVRANVSNDYTVYLPINPHDSDNDFTVFWGDGKFSYYNHDDWSGSFEDGPVHHYYEGITGAGKNFTVTVSGTVRHLYSGNIIEGYRTAIIAVKQWGHTGLTDMGGAFEKNLNLTTLPADETLAFAEVGSFGSAFRECPKLENISPRLFQYATKAYDFGCVFYKCKVLSSIPEGLFSRCVSTDTFYEAFKECRMLKTVPKNLFANCKRATGFEGVFEECDNLETISSGVFKGCTEARNFYRSFCRCPKLRSIPEDLFADCANVQTFACTFHECDALTTLPGRLFRNNSKVESFDYCFWSCDDLVSIQRGLFDNCPIVTNMSCAFGYCEKLISVPENLFDNMKKVSNFEQCFVGCYAWTGESPYSYINGKKVHLYERADYPDYFVSPTYFGGCLGGCWSLSDWNAIPSEWGWK